MVLRRSGGVNGELSVEVAWDLRISKRRIARPPMGPPVPLVVPHGVSTEGFRRGVRFFLTGS
jgi:hypothetical protein